MKTIKISQKTAYDLAKWLDEQCGIIMRRKFDGTGFEVFNEGTNDWLQLRGKTEEERIGFMALARINGITKFYVNQLQPNTDEEPKSAISFYLPYGFEVIRCMIVLEGEEGAVQGILDELLKITIEVV